MKYLLLAAALLSAGPALAATQAPLPATGGDALHYIESKGVTVDARFSVPGGLHGYAATMPNGQRGVFFTSADGKVLIFGTLVDAHGTNLTRAFEHAYVQRPQNKKNFSKLEKAHWIKAGAENPKRIIYAFVDPNCPYCWEFWKTAQKTYSKGVQVRYIVVGILGSSSVKKAATILGSQNPLAALEKNERGFKHHSGAIAPMKKVSDKLRREIAMHNRLMSEFGINGTPGLVWENSKGEVETSNGLPPSGYLDQIFGLSGKKD